ncbi:MAG: tRNA lysidine(34) synthetase TilS [Planctomycetales bacterium]|nr:tRNA lysidine(34) synthetase TilS [Planctomycetales bacterium]
MSLPLPERIAHAWPPGLWKDLHVLVAVSGGADSVALLLGLIELKRQSGGRGRLYVGHFDHRLRAESGADAQWVMELGKSLGIEVIAGRHDSEGAGRLASEQSARQARYEFLLATAQQLGARYVPTGHTADDQTETVLHRALRGASIQGLGGIPFTRALSEAVQVVRPLLKVTRAEVERFLSERGQSFRTDATNHASDFTRNALRNEVLPLLRERFGEHVDQSLRRLAWQAAEAHAVIESLAQEIVNNAVQRDDSADTLLIDPNRFGDSRPIVLREAFKSAWNHAGWPLGAMGAEEWQRLLDFTRDPEAAAFDLPGGVSVGWEHAVVVLRRARH